MNLCDERGVGVMGCDEGVDGVLGPGATTTFVDIRRLGGWARTFRKASSAIESIEVLDSDSSAMSATGVLIGILEEMDLWNPPTLPLLKVDDCQPIRIMFPTCCRLQSSSSWHSRFSINN